jgi:hypothetical protein
MKFLHLNWVLRVWARELLPCIRLAYCEEDRCQMGQGSKLAISGDVEFAANLPTGRRADSTTPWICPSRSQSSKGCFAEAIKRNRQSLC